MTGPDHPPRGGKEAPVAIARVDGSVADEFARPVSRDRAEMGVAARTERRGRAEGGGCVSEIGKLVQLPNIRQVWKREEADFTRWLSDRANLSILSDALGFGPDGLDLVGVEVALPGGGYHADILARITGSAEGDLVLIENQFGKSDHDHLGKLLTYASGLKAKVVVLIGEAIRIEHRAALDWLNTITNEDHGFFACEIELWRIDESLPAPRFNVVVRPNDWSREKPVVSDLSDTRQTQLAYWTGVEKLIGAIGGPIGPVKALAQSWVSHGIGKTGVGMNFAIQQNEKWVRVEIYLSGKNAKARFAELRAHSTEIERALGEQLDWQELPERQDCRICLALRDADLWNESDWPRQHKWIVETAKSFHRVFRPYLATLSDEAAKPGGAAP